MKIECIHGYFKFTEKRAGDASDFISRFGLELVRVDDWFTFADLIDAPDYSLAGSTFLGCAATETFEGNPWDVMRANGIVYDFSTGLVVPIESIVRTVSPKQVGKFFVASGMIAAGSLTDDGKRVTDYAAHYENLTFRYSEISSE